MTEALTTMLPIWAIALVISVVLGWRGPEKYREAAWSCAAALTVGGLLVLVLQRQRKINRPRGYHLDTTEHEETDERLGDIDADIAAVDERMEEIEATEARGYWDEGELGSEMAKRLKEDDNG